MKFESIPTIQFTVVAFIFYQLGAWNINFSAFVAIILAAAVSIIIQHVTSTCFPRDAKPDPIQSNPETNWKLQALLTQLSRNPNMPKWVRYPNWQKVSWMNKLFVALWPFLKPTMEKKIVNVMQNILMKKKPDFVQTVQIANLNIGNFPVKFHAVSVNTISNEVQDIIIDCETSFNSGIK